MKRWKIIISYRLKMLFYHYSISQPFRWWWCWWSIDWKGIKMDRKFDYRHVKMTMINGYSFLLLLLLVFFLFYNYVDDLMKTFFFFWSIMDFWIINFFYSSKSINCEFLTSGQMMMKTIWFIWIFFW